MLALDGRGPQMERGADDRRGRGETPKDDEEEG
jgi:hypothetical protein